jgi:hypothetical protein
MSNGYIFSAATTATNHLRDCPYVDEAVRSTAREDRARRAARMKVTKFVRSRQASNDFKSIANWFVDLANDDITETDPEPI